MSKKAIIIKKSMTFAIITALALLVRISYFSNTDYDHPIRGDAAHYLVYAQNFHHFSTFSKDTSNSPPIPDSYWAPGYPFFFQGF